jgi:Raf kinase inhibitor-like YbhB/YbcL family protein
MWHRRLRSAVALLCAAGLSGCGGGSSSAPPGTPTSPGAAPDTITVTSTAFTDGATIPVRFTCDGAETSPELAWSGGGKPAAWALVVDDPDAPGGTFVHWVVLDIPTATRSLAAGVAPSGATQVTNSAGSASYAGPCPPSGTHHYRFTVYALPEPTGLSASADTGDALAEVRSSATAQGTLVGLYSRGS